MPDNEMQVQDEKRLDPPDAEAENKDIVRPTSDDSASARDVELGNGGPANGRDGQTSSHLPFSKARCIALVTTVTGASFMNTFSAQAVIIILPTIGRDLNIPESRLQWVVSAYSLAFGCFLLLWGRIADIYGKRRIFVWGSAWMAVSTAANPFIPNEIGFDLFRGLQGLGAAANVPTAIGILGTTFKPGKAKNYAFTAYAAGAPLGSIFGNLLAGIVAQLASWKWVFGMIAMLSAVVTVAGLFIIPPPPTTLRDQGVTAKGSVDWIGGSLITIGLLALLFALSEGNIVGWSTAWVPVLIVVSLILIGLFILWQHHLEHTPTRPPLMKVSIFRSGRFAAAMGIMALFFSSFNGFLIYATYFYQSYQGLNPLDTTLRFVATGVSGAMTSVVVSQLLARVPTYTLLLFGNLSMSIAILLFAAPIPPATTYFAWGLPAMVLSVIGADITWPCLTLFTSSALPQADQAMGGALVNAVGQVGRAIGLAIATAIQTAVMARDRGVSVENVGPVLVGDDASLAGLRAADWFNFATGILTVVVVAAAFRGSGIVGRAEVRAEQAGLGGREEGIVQDENTISP